MKEELKRRLMKYAEKKTLRQKVIPGIILALLVILLLIYKFTGYLSSVPVTIFGILILIYLVISRALDTLIKSDISARKNNKWLVLIFSDYNFVSDFCIYLIICPVAITFINVFPMPSSVGLQILITIVVIIISIVLEFFMTNKICKFVRKWRIEDKEG